MRITQLRQANVNPQVVFTTQAEEGLRAGSRAWHLRKSYAAASKFTCTARASAPPYLDYSSRSASTGSIRIALRAGTSAASAEISNSAAGTLTNVAASIE